MADTKAQIVISARDDTSGAINQAKANFARLKTDAAATAAQFASLAASISGVLAVTGLVELFRSTVRGLDALNDLKDATGATVENLSALEDVAARTGTSFDAVGTALVKFNGALNSAGEENSKVARVLQSIGLQAEELKRADPAEALRRVAVALAQYADDGNKARAVQELFGRSLREVAPFLNDLANAGRLNATVTAEQAAAAERFNQQLDGLAKNTKDAARGLVADLLPALSEAVREFNIARESFGGLLGALARTGPFAKGFDTPLRGLQYYRAELDKVNASLAKIASGDEKSTGLFGTDRVAPLKAQAAELGKFVTYYERLAGLTSQAGAGRGFIVPGMEGGGAKPSIKVPNPVKPETLARMRTFTDYAQEINTSLGKLAEEADLVRLQRLNDQLAALDKLAASGFDPAIVADIRARLLPKAADYGPPIPDDLLDRQKRLNDILAQTPSAKLQEQRQVMGDLTDAFLRGQISVEKYTEAAQTLTGQLPELTQEMDRWAAETQKSLEQTLGDSLYLALDGRFDDIEKAWGDMLKRMLVEALQARLSDFLFGDDLFGGTGVIGGFFAGLFGGARAAGGPVDRGRAYLVGERGPEMFVPRTAGEVVPNGSLGGVHTTINVAAGPTRAEVASAIQVALGAYDNKLQRTLRAARVI